MAFLITAVLAAAATQSAQTTQVAYSKHHYPTRRAAKAVQAAACPATVASSGYVSLRDFGALGEGKKDDSDALRQAINMTHLCGGSVLIPQGKYLINSTVALHHVSLFGAGMSVPSEIGTAYATGRTVTLFTLSKEPIFSIGMRNVTVSYASDVYLEGLDIEGITIAVTVCNVDWVRIRNCGLRAAWDPSFKGDNAALVVANSYWIWVEEGSAVELRASMDNPSVILRGNDDDVAYIR